MLRKYALVGIVLITIVATSCTKTWRDNDNDTTIAKSYAISDQYLTDGYFWAHKLLSGSDFIASADSIENAEFGIKSIDVSSTVYPVEFIVDFGNDSNNVCADNRVRNGQLRIKAWNPYRQKGATFRITGSFYEINGISVDFEDSLTHTGGITNTYSSRIRDAYLLNDTIKIEWSSNLNYEWKAGDSTAALEDDFIHVTGQARAFSYNGAQYIAEITSPLIRTLNCHWITVGKVTQKADNIRDRKLDYGLGVCENFVEVGIGESAYTITID